jgi:ABC-type nitrate/sulfonate/bicarbonate transport system permease component
VSILPSQQPNKGFLGIVGVPILLGVWALASYSGAVNPLVLPPPSRVFLSVLDIGFPIVLHIGATTARIVLGFALATLLGCAVGLLMQYSRVCFSLIDGLIETSRPVPPVALVPFFILIFGFSETGRLLLVVIGASLIITVTVVEAIARVPPGLICSPSF